MFGEASQDAEPCELLLHSPSEGIVIGQLLRANQGQSTYTRDDVFFLHRLERLVDLHPEGTTGFDAPALLRRAIYSTYIECRVRGLEAEARGIMRRQSDKRA